MSNHYYTEKPSAPSDRRTWKYQLRGMELTFTSDAGVFSKKEVDFGTRLLLDEFVFPDTKGDILDMGCGYGPIGLTLAKEQPERNVFLIDMNERAIELSEYNASVNKIKNVTVKKSNLFSEVVGVTFDAIISNPPIRAGKKVVHQLFEDAAVRLNPNGEIWIVIQKKQGAPSAIEKLKELFLTVEIVKKSKGYYIIKAKRN